MKDCYDPFGFNEAVVRPERPSLEVKLEDFRAYMKKEGACIYTPTGELWPSANVNKRVPPIFVGLDDQGKPKYISAATWLYRNRPVEQMTWSPGDDKRTRGQFLLAQLSAPRGPLQTGRQKGARVGRSLISPT
jgi:hypothetical protein